MKYSLHPSVPTPHLSFKFRTGPASAPSLAEKHKGHREAARIGTGELPSSNGEAQTHGACLALRPAPRHRHMRARCLLYACRIPRSAVPPPGRAPHRTTLPEKKASASLPSMLRGQEIRFGIIIPLPSSNLYHFCIYVNDFLSDFLHSRIKSIFFDPYEYSIKATIFI